MNSRSGQEGSILPKRDPRDRDLETNVQYSTLDVDVSKHAMFDLDMFNLDSCFFWLVDKVFCSRFFLPPIGRQKGTIFTIVKKNLLHHRAIHSQWSVHICQE